jgi:dolichol-phosphate mannosyltransferase
MSKTLVIIPTYNEIDNIKNIISAVFCLEEDFHVLIVDDGSPDGTATVVKELMTENPDRLFIEERSGKLGLGTAYIHGFKWALPKGYEYIFEMDADFSHKPNDLLKLLKACREEGADLSIGSRYVTGVNVVNWPMSRVLMSYFASVYVRWITRMPVRDSTAGFKCYTRKVLETIELEKIKFVGYAFQIEMKFTAWKYGFKITEVPIIFTDRQKGNSKMHSGIFKEAVLGVLQMTITSWFKTFKR